VKMPLNLTTDDARRASRARNARSAREDGGNDERVGSRKLDAWVRYDERGRVATWRPWR
jgi:hypothetical protein